MKTGQDVKNKRKHRPSKHKKKEKKRRKERKTKKTIVMIIQKVHIQQKNLFVAIWMKIY